MQNKLYFMSWTEYENQYSCCLMFIFVFYLHLHLSFCYKSILIKSMIILFDFMVAKVESVMTYIDVPLKITSCENGYIVKMLRSKRTSYLFRTSFEYYQILLHQSFDFHCDLHRWRINHIVYLYFRPLCQYTFWV